jgi:hypothetical protein
MKPGTIVLPLASMRCAPAGIAVDAGPTAAMRPLLMTSVPRSIGARPVPSMMRALVRATAAPAAGVCASVGGETSVARARAAPTTRTQVLRMFVIKMCIFDLQFSIWRSMCTSITRSKNRRLKDPAVS